MISIAIVPSIAICLLDTYRGNFRYRPALVPLFFKLSMVNNNVNKLIRVRC